MYASRFVLVLLFALSPLSVGADDSAGRRSALLSEWIYPEADRLQEGRTAGTPPVAETGQYTTEASVQEVLRFYASRAGLEANAKPLDLALPDDAGMVAVSARDDTSSAILLRNVGQNTTTVTLLYWTPGDSEKIVVSLTRGQDDPRTHIQLVLHRQK